MAPNEFTDYSQGKVYELVCNVTGLVYVGSTVMTMVKRMDAHRSPASECHSKKVMAAGDFTDKVLELFPCSTVKELVARENIFIKQYQDLYGELCVNRDTFLTKSEYNARFYSQDAQAQRDRSKKYKVENKEKVRAQKRLRIECEYCGDMIMTDGKARHQKRSACWINSSDGMCGIDVSCIAAKVQKVYHRVKCGFCGDMVQTNTRRRHERNRDCWTKACDGMNMIEIE